MSVLNKIFFFFIFLLINYQILGQEDNSYDLLTERYVDRPIAMHKGQLQFNSGYEFSIINRKYDVSGKKIDLATDGSVSAKHLMPFELKFGILEYLQLTASTGYASIGLRNQNHNIGSSGSILYVSELTRYKGFNDLFLGTALTAPIKWHPVNFVISAGIFLPLFNHEPDKPEHSYTILDPTNGSASLIYKYNNKYSGGAMIGLLGTSLKIRTSRISLTGSFIYSTGLKDAKSVDWKFRLVENEFQYQKDEYQFNPGITINYYSEVAVQAIPWFTITSAFNGYKSSDGWSNITGKKVGYIKKSLNNLSLGYEILVSQNLRLEQHVILPVSGKNIMAQWAFLTGISLNIITFAD